MRKRLTLAVTAATTLATALLAASGVNGSAHAAVPAGAVKAAVSAKAGQVTVVNGCITSVPEPGSTTPVKICYTTFEPAGASAQHPVPMIMHSHGWGGSRTTTASSFSELLSHGYGVLSFDQRGFGESGGQAHVEAPAYEGHDVRKLVSLVSHLPWVQQDRPGDPHLGAIGGSYGGGYQFLGAFEELRLHGTPIFDALAPEITWNDLEDSLAPEGVVRSEWASALSAAAVPSDALPHEVYAGLAEGAATGTFPDGSIPGTTNLSAFFAKNGPKYHIAQGDKLDIPVLFGQGTTDSLFPLAQGLANWRTAITPAARQHSIFIGYNGGHVLPAIFPRGVSVTSDPCSNQLAGGDFAHLAVRFFDEQLKGKHTGLTGYDQLHIATPTSTCTTIASPRATTTVPLGTVVSTEGAGAPLPYAVADGPIKIAGTPYLTGAVTALGVQNRAFYGLAMGTSPADAQLVQDNVYPLNEPLPVSGKQTRIDLPSLAVDVPAGQHLYLLVTPISDSFAGFGSRTPGLVAIQDTVVHLPQVGR